MDPDPSQIEAVRDIGADSVEINTGLYTELDDPEAVHKELAKIQTAARHGREIGLRVFAGHGLNNQNVVTIAAIPEIEELNIGHNLVARSVYCGMEEAVREMKKSIEKGVALRPVSA